MALIKVLIIFVVILALLNKRLPLYLAMIFGSLLMIVMFRLPLATAGQTALHTLTGWDVWSVNLAMYVISVLVYELDLRHRFEDAQRAMNGLMRDPRRNTSLACMFIGLMQGPATVTICGGMVDTMAGDHLKNDKKGGSCHLSSPHSRGYGAGVYGRHRGVQHQRHFHFILFRVDAPDGAADASGDLPCLPAPRAAHSRRDGTQ